MDLTWRQCWLVWPATVVASPCVLDLRNLCWPLVIHARGQLRSEALVAGDDCLGLGRDVYRASRLLLVRLAALLVTTDATEATWYGRRSTQLAR